MHNMFQLSRSVTTGFFLPMSLVLVMQAAALLMLSVPAWPYSADGDTKDWAFRCA